MLLQRTLVAMLLLPFGVAAILAGGMWFAAMMAVILVLAALEFVNLFKAGGLQPTGFLVVGGVLSIIGARYYASFEHDAWLLPLLVLLSMAAHLWAYERGRDLAGTDFAVTVAGIAYLGLMGAFFIALRALPEGEWWLLVSLPAIWLADSGAYFIGTRFGRHKMTPRLSPKKSWEGYFGGILVAVIGTPLLAMLYRSYWLPPETAVTPANAAVLGLAMGVFPTLGDLGESMIKRQVGRKDSGGILPGHGGMFDRIDSWLWGVFISYYVVVWFL